MARGLLLLAALWWAWTAYAWLTSSWTTTRAARGLRCSPPWPRCSSRRSPRPGAFDENAVLFGVAYLAVRVLHILIYGLATNDVNVRQAVRTLAPDHDRAHAHPHRRDDGRTHPGAALGCGARDRLPRAAARSRELALPAVALRGAPRADHHHRARRVDRRGRARRGRYPLSAGVVAAAVLGLVVSVALWWAYFDVVAIVAERRLVGLTGGGSKPDGARLLQLPPHADGGGHRPHRARCQEDARPRRRPARARPGCGPLRRSRRSTSSPTSRSGSGTSTRGASGGSSSPESVSRSSRPRRRCGR